jgi:hypothetical protein
VSGTGLDRSGDWIAAEPQHWQEEPFLPVPSDHLLEFLCRQPAFASPRDEELRRAAERIGEQLHAFYRDRHERAASLYAALDPDRDVRLIIEPTAAERRRQAADLAELIVDGLRGANYTRLSRQEIEAALEAVSDWGVRLRVNFHVFEHLEVWARGDIIGQRERRHWRDLWRPKSVDVAIYQRLAVMFQVRAGQIIDEQLDPLCLHLRMFKNIPQADVDMLLPSTRVRLGWVDRWKILVPTLSGISLNLFKIIRGAVILAFVGAYGTVALLALIAASISYAVRSFLHFGRARDRYLLNMSRNLYFQKLDSNAGVIARLLDEAEQQDEREALLAYAVLAAADGPLPLDQVKRRAIQWILEAIQVAVDFEADDAMRRLEHLRMARQDSSGDWSLVSF